MVNTTNEERVSTGMTRAWLTQDPQLVVGTVCMESYTGLWLRDNSQMKERVTWLTQGPQLVVKPGRTDDTKYTDSKEMNFDT